MGKNTRVAFVSLGCPKNTVDSEKMLGQLAEAGCEFTNGEADADVVVVNTCGFLAAARAEALDVLKEMIKVKRSRKTRLRRIVAAGCLVQRDGTDLLQQLPGIDAIVGVHNRDDVVRAVLQPATQKTRTAYLDDYYPMISTDRSRLKVTPQHWSYLRICEGCNQKCTFCTIPAIRGPLRSKPIEVVLDEAKELISHGTVELCLIGQDTTAYGIDIHGESRLAELLHRLNALDGLKWLRLMYVYPTALSDDVLKAIAHCDKLVKYIDMPLQHISDRILKAMHRRVDRTATIGLLDNIRGMIPDVHLRTTLISGFPGETAKEHQELLDFVTRFRFDALGVFAYSLEPDTPAGRMSQQVAEDVKLRRVEELMLAQQEIAFAKADALVGKSIEVLVDTSPHGGWQQARHSAQAPEVDNITWLCDTEFPTGTFAKVKCIGRNEYDLCAEADVQR